MKQIISIFVCLMFLITMAGCIFGGKSTNIPLQELTALPGISNIQALIEGPRMPTADELKALDASLKLAKKYKKALAFYGGYLRGLSAGQSAQMDFQELAGKENLTDEEYGRLIGLRGALKQQQAMSSLQSLLGNVIGVINLIP